MTPPSRRCTTVCMYTHAGSIPKMRSGEGKDKQWRGRPLHFSISLTIGVRMKNSTDLSSGPGPHHNALGRLMRTPFLRAAAVAVCRRRRPPHGPPPPSRAIAGSTSTCDTCLSHPCFYVGHTDAMDTWEPSNPALWDHQGLFSPWYIRLLHILGIRPIK